MEIIIPLPNFSSGNDYAAMKGYLKQLETAIHYAQKSVENAQNSGVEVSEDMFVEFQHSGLDKGFAEDNYNELQNVSLRINLQ